MQGLCDIISAFFLLKNLHGNKKRCNFALANMK